MLLRILRRVGRKMRTTRTWLLGIGGALLLASSILFALFFTRGGSGNSLVPTIRVACVGDSITDASGYVNDLWTLLDGNYTVGNFGVGGATVSQGDKKPYASLPEFEGVKGFRPDIVVIMLGTNDAPEIYSQGISTFTSDYEALIRGFQNATSKPDVWLVKPPPIFNNTEGFSSQFLLQEVIPRIEQVANQTGLPLIDVYTPLASHPEYFPDGVHPYGEGARIIATEVFNAITANVTG